MVLPALTHDPVAPRGNLTYIAWHLTCHVPAAVGVQRTPCGRGTLRGQYNSSGQVTLAVCFWVVLGARGTRCGWHGRRMTLRWSPSRIAAVPLATFSNPVRREIWLSGWALVLHCFLFQNPFYCEKESTLITLTPMGSHLASGILTGCY